MAICFTSERILTGTLGRELGESAAGPSSVGEIKILWLLMGRFI